MKKFILSLLLFNVSQSHGQAFNNEWIDYDKAYYKFKIGSTGLCRITQSLLASNGLAGVPVEQFQLWRNGSQIPLYTSVPAGVLPPGGYLEFWGEKNDGEPDIPLYKNPNNHFSKSISLISDTAAFFLTVNLAGNNLRLLDAPNDVAGNTLPAETSFSYNYRNNFQELQNRGRAIYFGTNVYSSTYDVGEFWSTREISNGTPYSFSVDNLFPAGGTGTLTASFAGNSINGSGRVVNVSINGNTVISQGLGVFDAKVFTTTGINSSVFAGPNVSFQLSNTVGNPNDRVVSGFVNLEYQRLFNFGGSRNFKFNLPPTQQGYYLEITNFDGGTASPVLYDLTSGKRITANTSVPGKYRFVLPALAQPRSLVLVKYMPDNILDIQGLQKRVFQNYNSAALQGDYLIISNKLLMTDKNPVEEYRAYRSSDGGGAHQARVYDIEELEDQFSYGIKRHPLSVKNFLRFARRNFAVKPVFVFLIGKAVSYDEYNQYQSSSFADKLNLVPTFGWPASDVLLASENNEPLPATFIGRLAAVAPEEVELYLDKVKAFEQQQQNNTQTIGDKAWMKTMVHVTGANDPGLDFSLTSHLNDYRRIISDTLFGANVYSFNKTTTGTATPITDALMTSLFESGISLLNYFGHSSATVLDYNLNSPYDYNNQNKYPVFLVNGCNAGNIYSYDTTRLSLISSLSENFVFAKDRGVVGFIASTHFGVESYLDAYNSGFYQSLSAENYNKPVSHNISDAIEFLIFKTRFLDSSVRYLHAEETCLHGDPAIKINAHEKPDFVIEESQVNINPTFISVADTKFEVKIYFHNIGKASGQTVNASVVRQYPDGSLDTLFSQPIKSIRFKDSVFLTVPIVASRDKGDNRLIVTIDNLSQFDEISELNNTVSKSFFVIEDELRPVYPYNFAIVNKQNQKLIASTANPFSTIRDYVMEIDTTELFNSSLKATQVINSVGGLLEFDPVISFIDSTVYYWRVAPVNNSGENRWNTSSFVYLSGTARGMNQSHFYQHQKSGTERIRLDGDDRKWKFNDVLSSLGIVHSVFPYSGTEDQDFRVTLNGLTVTASACIGKSVIFNLFDPVTLLPYFNQAMPSTTGVGQYGGFMGSAGYCSGTGKEYNFEFGFWDTTGRRQMRDFMDWIPNGAIVTVRLLLDEPITSTPFVDTWQQDAGVYGAGNTWYDRLKTVGFADVDSFYFPRIWVLNYQKNNSESFPAKWQFSNGLFDRIFYQRDISSADTLGYITSPVFGQAANWKQVQWRGSGDVKPGDDPQIEIIGLDASLKATVLFTINATQQNFDISSVNASAFPYMQLRMRNVDSINLTPYQLRWWRVLYDPIPEGALAPNILLKFKDSVDLGQPQDFAIAFKNISDVPFSDSVLVKMQAINADNVASDIPLPKLKPLIAGDTAVIKYAIPTDNLEGNNNIFVDVNPDSQQPEQYHFNNFLYQAFKVGVDRFRPVMDVTFDGVHILNNDIVSAQPHIQVRLTDNATFLLLDDTSLFNVRLQYPDGTMRRFYFNTDTLLFTPATGTNNENVATVDFYPLLSSDGQYQLLISAKDKSGNPAGTVEYVVSFMVYNKPMITNLFNYPNPFTSSTSFVFTVTGQQPPQNIRIQILTITGKIVREITSAELGPIHVGRNITDFKWDGTDQFGQRLANGVYLYRVLTNLNGASLDKFPTFDKDGFEVNTDQYFNKGYGKMYLMR